MEHDDDSKDVDSSDSPTKQRNLLRPTSSEEATSSTNIPSNVYEYFQSVEDGGCGIMGLGIPNNFQANSPFSTTPRSMCRQCGIPMARLCSLRLHGMDILKLWKGWLATLILRRRTMMAGRRCLTQRMKVLSNYAL